MSDPFIGEIRLWATSFAPMDWAYCDGQFLSSQQYAALNAVIGTTYGGSVNINFALPDLRGRAPVHAGGDIPSIGDMAGAETHTLIIDEMPIHSHCLMAVSSEATDSLPEGRMLSKAQSIPDLYASSPNCILNPSIIGTTGENKSHPNIQPSLGLAFCIALNGIFPVRQ